MLNILTAAPTSCVVVPVHCSAVVLPTAVSAGVVGAAADFDEWAGALST